MVALAVDSPTQRYLLGRALRVLRKDPTTPVAELLRELRKVWKVRKS
jgi:hypothetical protein